MVVSSSRTRVKRTPRYESFEERAMMTADAVTADFHIDYLADDAYGQSEVSTESTATSYAFTGLAAANTYGLNGAGQTVAIIDSGIAYDHPALGGGFGTSYRVVGGWDFTEENDANPYDDGPAGSHGTHVAGIVGSTDATNPGVAPGVDLVALRVFNDQGNGYFSWMENALKWVHENRNSFRNPITTVNLSVGSVWNSTTLPSWAILEDEFAQLKADGIFIAVAAGNSFTTYNAAGLSYPAASSYVVPVASVDTSGNLSSFSQRQERVLAAPGQSIRSTVPDYVGNLNKKADDFANYSGTSMASPFLAGASTLVRQALQTVGRTGINQDMIYGIMRSTADSIYDAITKQNYARVNVGRALASILPADDFGSTASTGYGVTPGLTTSTLAGMIGRTDDRDYFTFTAGISGRATFSATGNISAQWELVAGSGTAAAGTFSFDVIAGRSYTIGLSSQTVGSYSLAMQVRPTETAWGSVDYRSTTWNGGSQEWFSVSAANSALFSVQAGSLTSGARSTLEIYNSNWQLVGSSATGTATERIDVVASRGDVFHVRLTRTGAGSLSLGMANVVSLSGTTVSIATPASSSVQYSVYAGSTVRVSLDGVAYQFAPNAVLTVKFTGASPAAVNIYGTTGDDTVVASPGSLTVTGAGYQLAVSGVQNYRVLAGGGNDVATVNDSAGNDTFEARRTVSTLTGSGFSIALEDFDRVEARATSGNDMAWLYDSTGDDVFGATSTFAENFGPGYYTSARGFDKVMGVASEGGYDTAWLHDSAGDDVFGATSTFAEMLGNNFYNSARGFDVVHGQANSGGFDTAWLYDSPGDDVFGATSTFAELFGKNFYNSARGFDVVHGLANSGGFDVAWLHDSAGDDVFGATPTYAEMCGKGFLNSARGFDRVTGLVSSGGNDVAYLHDSTGVDQLTAAAGQATLSGLNYSNLAIGFAQVNVLGHNGSINKRAVNAVDFNLNFYGLWE